MLMAWNCVAVPVYCVMSHGCAPDAGVAPMRDGASPTGWRRAGSPQPRQGEDIGARRGQQRGHLVPRQPPAEVTVAGMAPQVLVGWTLRMSQREAGQVPPVGSECPDALLGGQDAF